MKTVSTITLVACESSQISAFGYDAASRVLAVQFPGRGTTPGSVYHYADVPPEVGFTAIYSKTDGVVNWQACLDPCADLVEVRSSHVGMGANAAVYAEIGHALASFRDEHAWARAA